MKSRIRLLFITNYQIIAAGGIGFHYPTSDTRSVYYVVSNTTVTNPDKVKRIVIALGYNDFKATSSDVTTNGTNFMSYLNTRFPNAKIYLGMCGFAWTQNANGIVSADISNTIRDYNVICKDTNAIFMPQCSGALLGAGPTSMSTGDYKHPTETGNRAIAEAIWAALHGQSFVQRTSYTTAFTNSTITLSGELFMPITVTDGVVSGRIKFNSFSFNTASAQNLYNLTGTAAHLPCFPYDTTVHAASFFHNYDSGSGISRTYIQCPIIVNPSSADKVTVQFMLMNDAGSNYAASKHVEINDITQYGFTVSY